MIRVPPRRGDGSSVVVKSQARTMPVRVVSGNNAVIHQVPLPPLTTQSLPKYQ
jgi:hypothetical protein